MVNLLRHLGLNRDKFFSGRATEKRVLDDTFIGTELSIESTQGSLRVFAGLQENIRNMVLSNVEEQEIEVAARQRGAPLTFEHATKAPDGTLLYWEVEQ